MKYRKYKPYIRKIRGNETSEDLRTAICLAFYTQVGGYVMLQHGFPNNAIAVGKSREEIIDSLIGASTMGFKKWAKLLQKRARG